MYKTGIWGKEAKERSNNRKEYFKKYNKLWREKNFDYADKYYSKNKITFGEYRRRYLRKKRNQLLEILGNKCVKCGFSDWRALQVDHIAGGGNKDRKNNSKKVRWKYMIESIKNKENKFQLLCANCNFIKRYENNEVGKRGET